MGYLGHAVLLMSYPRNRINLHIFVNFYTLKQLLLLFVLFLFFSYFILQFLKESDTSEYNTHVKYRFRQFL